MPDGLRTRSIISHKAPDTTGNYAQAVEVLGATRTLFVSGQVPQTKDGYVPDDFEAQARLAWANIVHQLEAADMTLDHVVKHTTYLSSYDHRDTLRAVRLDVFGDRKPALTVIIADIFDPKWLLEVEAIAVA